MRATRSRSPTAQTAAPCVSSAGCALCVSVSSSAGPSKQSVLRARIRAPRLPARRRPRGRKGLGKILAHAGFLGALPGKEKNDVHALGYLEAHDHRAPREAGAERDEHHDRAFTHASLLRSLRRARSESTPTTCCRSGRRSRNLVHRDPACFAVASMMRDIRLVRNQQVDVAAGELRADRARGRCLGHRAHGVLEHFASRHAARGAIAPPAPPRDIGVVAPPAGR